MLEFSGLLATDTLPNQIKRKWMKEELRCSKKKKYSNRKKKKQSQSIGNKQLWSSTFENQIPRCSHRETSHREPKWLRCPRLLNLLIFP